MIKYVTGDLLAADSEALVNSVNCVGVMGAASRSRSGAGSPKTSRRTRLLATGAHCSRAGCSCSRPAN